MSRRDNSQAPDGYLHGFPTARDIAAGAALTYLVDTRRDILLQQWRGSVQPSDVLAHWRRLIADKATLSIGRHLNDLRGCRLEFSGERWLQMIAGVLETMPEHAPWRAAIVVDTAETAGAVRQFLGYAGDLVVAQVFLDMGLAEAWLLAE